MYSELLGAENCLHSAGFNTVEDLVRLLLLGRYLQTSTDAGDQLRSEFTPAMSAVPVFGVRIGGIPVSEAPCLTVPQWAHKRGTCTREDSRQLLQQKTQ